MRSQMAPETSGVPMFLFHLCMLRPPEVKGRQLWFMPGYEKKKPFDDMSAFNLENAAISVNLRIYEGIPDCKYISSMSATLRHAKHDAKAK